MSQSNGAAGSSGGQHGPLFGHLDGVTQTTIEGWAADEAYPDIAVPLRIIDNGVVIGEILANRPRAGLKEAGIGNGRNAFLFTIPGGLSPLKSHLIEIHRAVDGEILPNSPWKVDALVMRR